MWCNRARNKKSFRCFARSRDARYNQRRIVALAASRLCSLAGVRHIDTLSRRYRFIGTYVPARVLVARAFSLRRDEKRAVYKYCSERGTDLKSAAFQRLAFPAREARAPREAAGPLSDLGERRERSEGREGHEGAFAPCC
jgi:hypothetical protein